MHLSVVKVLFLAFGLAFAIVDPGEDCCALDADFSISAELEGQLLILVDGEEVFVDFENSNSHTFEVRPLVCDELCPGATDAPTRAPTTASPTLAPTLPADCADFSVEVVAVQNQMEQDSVCPGEDIDVCVIIERTSDPDTRAQDSLVVFDTGVPTLTADNIVFDVDVDFYGIGFNVTNGVVVVDLGDFNAAEGLQDTCFLIADSRECSSDNSADCPSLVNPMPGTLVDPNVGDIGIDVLQFFFVGNQSVIDVAPLYRSIDFLGLPDIEYVTAIEGGSFNFDIGFYIAFSGAVPGWIDLEVGSFNPIILGSWAQTSVFGFDTGRFTTNPVPVSTTFTITPSFTDRQCAFNANNECITLGDIDGCDYNPLLGLYFLSLRMEDGAPLAGTSRQDRLLVASVGVDGNGVPDTFDLVLDFFGPGIDWVEVRTNPFIIDGGRVPDVDGMAFFPRRDQNGGLRLFAVGNRSGTRGALFQVDYTTAYDSATNSGAGDCRLVGQFPVNDQEGLSFTQDEFLQLTTGNSSSNPADNNQILRLDVEFGELTGRFSVLSTAAAQLTRTDYEQVTCNIAPPVDSLPRVITLCYNFTADGNDLPPTDFSFFCDDVPVSLETVMSTVDFNDPAMCG